MKQNVKVEIFLRSNIPWTNDVKVYVAYIIYYRIFVKYTHQLHEFTLWNYSIKLKNI